MKSRLMELDPKYVDVIVTRLQMFTGLQAAHAATGELFPKDGGCRVDTPVVTAVEFDATAQDAF